MNFRANNLLVTGGAGFIGSNFIEYILDKYQKINVFNLDLLTYAGNLENTSQFCDNPRYTFIQGNICDYTLLKQLFSENKIDGVINFAAESHVDNSILNPKKFINSNFNGVFNLLSVCFETWMNSPFNPKSEYSKARFHQISTDEVYGSIIKGSFNEESNYNPNSPYSATKASADLLIRSFNKTYGLNTTISLCSNNFGPNQHKEKLIPKVIDLIKNNHTVKLYGDGTNIRDWIYVKDHCIAIDKIFNFSKIGEKYNIGGGFEISNIDLVKYIYSLSRTEEKISFIDDRFGHDFRYSLNSSKIKNDFDWKTKLNLFEYLSEVGY
tara:strand:- start:1779 stop:2750 length:972 start_codon:yes stop_codon:yes gene_type:complete